MAINLNACRLTKSGNIITPKGRLSYTYVNEPAPRGKKDKADAKLKYQTTLLLPKGVDLALMITQMNEAADEKFGVGSFTKHKIKKPFWKTEDYPKLAEFSEDFPAFIRTSTFDKPGVVNADGTACTDPTQIYSGRWACISIRASAYDHEEGGKGVKWYLQNVQLLDHDERIGGGRSSAEDDFEPVGGVAGGSSSDALFD